MRSSATRCGTWAISASTISLPSGRKSDSKLAREGSTVVKRPRGAGRLRLGRNDEPDGEGWGRSRSNSPARRLCGAIFSLIVWPLGFFTRGADGAGAANSTGALAWVRTGTAAAATGAFFEALRISS